MKNKQKGFTLIELLVVVLIIGILAAIAVPQYQKAVEKSRSAEALITLKAFADSVNRYYMEHSTYEVSRPEDLDIELPQSKNFIYTIVTGSADSASVHAVRPVGGTGSDGYGPGSNWNNDEYLMGTSESELKYRFSIYLGKGSSTGRVCTSPDQNGICKSLVSGCTGNSYCDF